MVAICHENQVFKSSLPDDFLFFPFKFRVNREFFSEEKRFFDIPGEGGGEEWSGRIFLVIKFF